MLLPAVPAAAQDLKGPLPMAGLLNALPAELAGWRRGAVTDFEGKPGGTGLGAAVEYRPAVGGPGVATIYFYDRGETGLPPGTVAPAVAGEIRRAVGEVEAVGPLRRFAVAARGPEADIAGADGRPALRCQPLVLAFEGGNRADSHVCLGVEGGHFVKLRMTLPASAESLSAKAVEAFGQALLAAVQPPPPPAPPARARRPGQ
ncbi:hypothetical protein [Roseicella aquatilis]|uniref:Uncharacterized protein n=1 Tax=Roseicella aquatilis TaxID=2527868 RepID=A0A4R4DB19_9PROT|nr:hypothetical protein [Roseicella aquatilis]TCZ56607.1 hypothetical protein EXY23_19640 [Roseicella aquatilis]